MTKCYFINLSVFYISTFSKLPPFILFLFIFANPLPKFQFGYFVFCLMIAWTILISLSVMVHGIWMSEFWLMSTQKVNVFGQLFCTLRNAVDAFVFLHNSGKILWHISFSKETLSDWWSAFKKRNALHFYRNKPVCCVYLPSFLGFQLICVSACLPF